MYKPTYILTNELLQLITEATELKTWIHQSSINVPWLPTLQRETALRLAYSSTSIEGNPLSLLEVKSVIAGTSIPASQKSKVEVLNQYAALKWVASKKPAQIGEKDLLHLHKTIMNQLLPASKLGHYKTVSNRIIDGRGRTVYVPPTPQQARPLTLDLLKWINHKDSKKIHPIIVSAIAHYRLVSIHPFSDGNGRISRALAIWLLYTRGFDTDHICALDEYFLEEHQLYYDKLTQARELDEDLTYWLEYVAKGIVRALENTKNRILSLQVNHQGSKIILTKRQEEVLRLIRDKGRIRSSDVEQALKITRARVAQIMKPLLEAKLVIREGQTKATTYRLKE